MSAAARTVTRATRCSAAALLVVAMLAAALLSAPVWASSNTLQLATDILLTVALACLWNFLAGYGGLVSVGQQAFVGLGGYALFALAADAGVPPLLCVPLAGLLAGLAALPIAGLLFRLQGAYFAISSWVIAEALRLGVSLVTPLGGGSGMSLPARVARSLGAPHARYATVYLAALSLLLAILLLVFLVLRSRAGLALTAIRDNPVAARTHGVDVGRVKLAVYVATACATAMVGALVFLQRLRISPDAAFSVNDWTALVVFMVVIGGIGSFEGPIVGAAVYFLARGALADLGPFYLMALGAIAIAVMLFEPRGIWGYVRGRWQVQLLPLNLRVGPPADSYRRDA